MPVDMTRVQALVVSQARFRARAGKPAVGESMRVVVHFEPIA